MDLPPDFADTQSTPIIRSRRPSDEIAALRKEVAALRQVAEENQKTAQGAFEILNHIQMFLKVMAMLEKVAVFLAKIAAGAAIIWALFRYGVNAAMDAVQSNPPK